MNQASPIGSVGFGKCARSRPKARGSTPFPGVQRNCSISLVSVSKRGAHHNRLSTFIGKPADGVVTSHSAALAWLTKLKQNTVLLAASPAKKQMLLFLNGPHQLVRVDINPARFPIAWTGPVQPFWPRCSGTRSRVRYTTNPNHARNNPCRALPRLQQVKQRKYTPLQSPIAGHALRKPAPALASRVDHPRFRRSTISPRGAAPQRHGRAHVAGSSRFAFRRMSTR